MGSARILRFKTSDVPRQQGEVGRLRVLKGPDQGTTFILKDSSITLGRGEDADIVLSDLKASRLHARLEYTAGGWVINDLGSANGVFFQGEYVRKFGVNSHDHFTLGESILEFLAHNESTKVLMAPMRPAQAVVQQDRALSAQRMKVQSIAKGPEIASRGNQQKQNPMRTLLLLAGVVAAYFLMQEPEQKAPPAKKAEKTEKQDRNLASFLPPGVGKEAAKSAEQSYREGFREYREGHYLRAKEHFELALQVNPGHELARFYLKSAEKEIDGEIKSMLIAAQKATAAGRLREAKGYYETAMRAMFNDKTNPDYIECEEALKKLGEELNRVPAGEGNP